MATKKRTPRLSPFLQSILKSKSKELQHYRSCGFEEMGWVHSSSDYIFTEGLFKTLYVPSGRNELLYILQRIIAIVNKDTRGMPLNLSGYFGKVKFRKKLKMLPKAQQRILLLQIMDPIVREYFLEAVMFTRKNKKASKETKSYDTDW